MPERRDMEERPIFSIITPSYNQGSFIEETIKSVLSQEGDFSIEHIIVDGGSTDETLAIIRKYETILDDGKWPIRCKGIKYRWISEKDRGMYDAVNKGFGVATGEIYAWINSDDLYLPGAFENIRRVFAEFPRVRWLKGITSFMRGSEITAGRCYLYDRDCIRKGYYGRGAYFIEQDSVFWRSELWDKAGGIAPGLKRAGDYDLWLKFASLTELYTMKAEVSCFRIHAGQLSGNMSEYLRECRAIHPSPGFVTSRLLRLFFILENRLVPRRIRPRLFRLLIGEPDFNLIEAEAGRLSLKKHGYYIG